MLVKARVMDKGMPRSLGAGDLLAGGESLANSTLATNGAGTLTAAILTSGFCVRTTVGAPYTDTTCTAALLLAAIPDAQVGDTFRFRHMNTVAQTCTLAAGTGCTLGTVPATTVTASSYKDYLVTITNATPATTVVCTIANGTKIITGMTLAQTSAVSVGQLVTGTGAGASAVVVSIQAGVGVTVDVNSTADNAAASFTFSPSYRVDAISMG